MGTASPVSIWFGVLAAALGASLFLFVVGRMFAEARRKRRLQRLGPDTSAYDADLRRYVDRVWLLVTDWKTRLPEGEDAALDELWQRAYEAAKLLQQRRATEEETSEDVARLVELENELEARISASTQLRR